MKYLFVVASVVSLLFFVFSSGKNSEYAAAKPLVAVHATVKNSADKKLFDTLAAEYKDTVSFSIRYVLPISIHKAALVINEDTYAPPFEKAVIKTLLDAEVVKKRALVRGDSVHEHADFAVFIEGKQLDFSTPQFQSTESHELDPDIHLHDGVGTVVHKHKAIIPLSDFFASLGVKFDDRCLMVDGQEFCTDQNELAMYVNGVKNDSLGLYVFHDLDTILVTAGKAQTEIEISKQLTTLTNDSCVYSEKCPERGKPPTEGCVGGLGSDCQ